MAGTRAARVLAESHLVATASVATRRAGAHPAETRLAALPLAVKRSVEPTPLVTAAERLAPRRLVEMAPAGVVARPLAATHQAAQVDLAATEAPAGRPL